VALFQQLRRDRATDHDPVAYNVAQNAFVSSGLAPYIVMFGQAVHRHHQVVLVLLAPGVAAAWIPASRAAGVDPSLLLKQD
jgi:hypothetical protein